MSVAVEIRAPAEQTEGTRSQVLRWLKSVGEPVAENEPLIEIETDKVTVEVAAPGTGILREIVKGEQEEITPGELLGRIEPASSAAGRVDAEVERDVQSANVRATDVAARQTAGAQAVRAGAGAEARPRPDIIDKGEGATRPATAAGSGMSAGRPAPAGAGAMSAERAVSRLSPAVRRLLTEHSLEPTAIRGTGVGGRITVEDVLLAATQANSSRASGHPGAAGAVRTEPATAGSSARPAVLPGTDSASEPAGAIGASHVIPHSPVRKRIAEHMVRSLLHTAPHVTTIFEADMTAVLAHRARYREEFARRGAPLTLTAYFLSATVDAIRAVPEANSRWTDTALEVFDSIHIGVATAVDEGLVVPVLRDVESRDLFDMAAGLDELVARAREGRLTPADVRGGTFTISNHGVSGSLLAAPIIINQPQSAILGIGKLEKRPTVTEEGGEDRLVILPRCYVTLTIDHRVMDGHRANRFLQTFVQRLTNWPE